MTRSESRKTACWNGRGLETTVHQQACGKRACARPKKQRGKNCTTKLCYDSVQDNLSLRRINPPWRSDTGQTVFGAPWPEGIKKICLALEICSTCVNGCI